MQKLHDLLKKISAVSETKNVILIAIDGRGGSGKTTLAEKLQQSLSQANVVHLDDFNYPMQAEDYNRLINQVILPLKRIGKTTYQVYDYKKKKLGAWQVIENSPIIIIEGVTALHPLLRSHFDYSIWVECPAEIGFKRGVAREIKLTGRDVTKNWLRFMPLEEKYIQEQSPQTKADYIIDGINDLE